MKLKNIYALVALFAIAFVGSAHAGGDGWMTDFEAAKVKAKAEGKPLLLDFTGSDWCGWCIKLNKEVFSKDAFKEYASAELVLVELDFPRDASKLPEGVAEQNEALAKKYNVKGFPTILVLSPEGELVEKTGYQRGGPEAYVEHIKEIVATIDAN
ncbi:MAG: thioredoxin family protein [Opitutaceae bacterium]